MPGEQRILPVAGRKRAAFALALLALAALVPPPAGAAVLPGQIDHVELATSSRNQGVGGPVVLTATVFIGSDPHRTEFVRDLNLTLSFPSGLQVIAGENPRIIAEQAVQPSAQFYAAVFTWTMNSTRVGDYRIDLVVTSAGAGGGTASVNLTVRVGPVVGKVNLQPGTPTTTTPLEFTVPANSGFDDTSVLLNVTLYVYQTTEQIKILNATRGALKLGNADRTWEFVPGTPLAMEEVGGGNYGYTFPADPPIARGALVYWVYAEVRLEDGTELGNLTSTPVRVFVQDPGTTAAVFWGAIASSTALVAGAFYVMFYDPWGRRAAAGSSHNSPDRVRSSLAMFVVGAVILAIAFMIGAADGLWRWFGYT